MEAGQYISGLAHAGLIGWAVIGGLISGPDPVKPPDVTEVALISEGEFMALTAPTPAVATDLTALPVPLLEEVADPAPVTDPAMDVAIAAPPPEAPAPDAPPPLPDAPEAPEPELLLDNPPLPSIADAIEDTTPSLPEEAAPQPVDRVAPVAAPEPPEPVETAPEPDLATRPDATAETDLPDRTAAAPEAAATEIVTEAKQGDDTTTTPPRSSPRPPARPVRPERVADTAPEPAAPAAPVAPVGPPLTMGEKDALRVAVQGCWNVGSLSSAAQQVTVTLWVTLSPEGKPDATSIRLLSSSGGDKAAVSHAYEAARRAIIRCGLKGYDLPKDKYAQWREIEMTFNPERMRIK